MSKRTEFRKLRQFSVEFKKAIVVEFEQGKFSVRELCKLHDLNATNVYQWIYKYSRINKQKIQVVEMKKSSTQKLKQKDARIQELERIIGQKQIEIDYLNKLISCASDYYGEDIKKNLNTKP